MEINNLKKQDKSTRLQSFWTKENLKAGFDKFYEDHGRYPTVGEIDTYEYLPSSRQIQRQYGGLRKLREELGIEIVDLGIGENRSLIATKINKRGNTLEKEIEKALVTQFGEIFVHSEKPLYYYYAPGIDLNIKLKSRADFFVYAKDKTFCIDIFHAQDFSTFTRVINIKEKKYSGVTVDVYLVNLNDQSNITDDRIDLYVANRKVPLESHLHLMNLQRFLDLIKSLTPLKVAT